MRISIFLFIIALIFIILEGVFIYLLIHKINIMKTNTITKQEQKIIEVSKDTVKESKKKIEEIKLFVNEQELKVNDILKREEERVKIAREYVKDLE